MKFINVHCPKCQQTIEVEAPRGRLSLPMAAAVLVLGVLIGIAGFASMPRHAPARNAAWIAPGGKPQELVDALPSVNLQELSQGAAMRSTSGGTKSLVIFNNKTAQRLQIYWLDYNGQRKSYGMIAPFSARPMETYATHPWLLVDDNDKPVALFVSLPGHCTATINGHS
jgi:hypothetical protein